jgi:hypothetical protein
MLARRRFGVWTALVLLALATSGAATGCGSGGGGAALQDAGTGRDGGTGDGGATIDTGPPADTTDGGTATPDGATGCGDGTCGAGETCASCPADCGACGVQPDVNELVVTEIMFDPAAVSDSAGEWFELHNPSTTTTFDLTGCELEFGAPGSAKKATIGALQMAPGAWTVFSRAAADNGGLPAGYTYGNLQMGNRTDTITLYCGAGAERHVVDSVTYGEPPAWPAAGGGTALSLSASALTATANDDGASWCAATGLYGGGDRGTPGAANPACPFCGDGTCAGDESCGNCVQDCGACRECGDDSCDAPETCTSCPQDCGVCPGCGDGSCVAPEDCASCPGDCGACGETPGADDLVISEIMYDPTKVGDTKGEWFELHNPSATRTFDLNGCVVEVGPIGAGTRRTLPSLVVPPGGWKLFARSDTDNGGLPPAHVYGSLSLPNDGGTLTLHCSPGAVSVIVDTVTWGSRAPWPAASGAALSLSAAVLDADQNDAPVSWCRATTPYGLGDLGTPGAANPVCPVCGDGDCLLPEDCESCPADCGACLTCGDGACTPPETCETCERDCGACSACGNGTCAAPETCATCPQDCGPCGTPPGAGELVISEIMVDPAKVSDTAGEWFEVYNPSAAVTYDLTGCKVAVGPPASRDTRVIGAVRVAPRSWTLFARAATGNGGLPTPDFVYGGLSLGNSGGTLAVLCGETGAETTVDSVTWTTSAPWRLQAGHALNLSADSLSASANDDGAAWCLANQAYGDGDLGTPGAANRVCQSGPVCDDGVCEATETCLECPQDCGVCPGPRPTAGQLVITEIMKDPAAIADVTGEWFEIYNPSPDTALNLDGCVLRDLGSDRHTIAGPLVIAAGAHLTFAKSAAPGFTPGYVYTGITFSNADDEIILECAGVMVDGVAYDAGAAFPDPTGASLQLAPDLYVGVVGATAAVSNDSGASWCTTPAGTTYGSGDRGTPGSQNLACP